MVILGHVQNRVLYIYYTDLICGLVKLHVVSYNYVIPVYIIILYRLIKCVIIIILIILLHTTLKDVVIQIL